MSERFSSVRPDLAQWWHEQPMFFVATAPSGDGGPREPLAQGSRHVARARPRSRRVPRPDRQRRRDDRAPAGERAHHADGVRVRRQPAHLPHLRSRRRAPGGYAGVRRAGAGVSRAAGPAFDHRHRGGAGHDVVRLRGPADGSRRRSRPAARVGRTARAKTASPRTGRPRTRRASTGCRESTYDADVRRPDRAGAARAWRSSASTRCCSRSGPTCRTSPATRRCRSNG